MMTERETRVALYARVSTLDKGQDPYNQMDIIRGIAERRGYEIVGEFADHASGKDGNRPEWQKVMDLARRHRIDAIMALRLDRVMRSVQHLCRVIEDLKDYRVRLLFSDMEFDPKSPNSVLTINILSSIAQWEREMLSARTREGLDRRRRQGVVLGRRTRTDIPVEDIARMRTEGLSWREIEARTGIPSPTIRAHMKRTEAAQGP